MSVLLLVATLATPATATPDPNALMRNTATNDANGSGADRPARTERVIDMSDGAPPPGLSVGEMQDEVPADGPSLVKKATPAREPPSGVPVLLVSFALVLLAVVAGFLAWALGVVRKRLTTIEIDTRALATRLQRVEALANSNPAAHRDAPAYGTDAQRGRAREPYLPEDPKPQTRALRPPAPDTPTNHMPVAPPPSRDPVATLAPLREELARLITAPGMRMADYDALLQRFGTLHGYDVTGDDGSGRLTSDEIGSTRRLSALVLPESGFVAIFPSARFVKDFDLTYKESLEAGSDVRAVFDLEPDGSAMLRITQFASARLSDDAVVNVSRGALGGFLR